MSEAPKEITLAEVKRRIKGLDKDRAKATVCALVGHSKIVSLCFGYVSCGRCEAQIGDKLGGVFDTAKSVVIGHNCKQCRANFKAIDWRSTFMAADPFKKAGAY